MRFLSLVVFLAILFSACAKKATEPGQADRSALPAPLPAGFSSAKPYFARVPRPANWSGMIGFRKPPRSFELASKWGPLYDLRQTDLSQLDLTGHAQDLLRAFFDTETKWPAALPPEFDPVKILDANRNPGFGIGGIHGRGVTGRGVSVGIIDEPLLLDHEEYGDRLRFYGEIGVESAQANFHGTLVTSVLAGRACGVAPRADIFYIGSHLGGADGPDATSYAEAVDMLLEVNARLPREKRIRVISISAGFGPKNPGYKAVSKAVRKAEAAGIFVVSGNMAVEDVPGMWFWGLDRKATDDPDDVSAYSVVSWKNWISQVAGRDGFERFYEKRLRKAGSPEFLLVSEGPRTLAGPFGRSAYGFYPLGGWSSILPYVAGLYALACKVKPDITPEVFWRAALATGDPMPVKTDWATYEGRRVDPARLIDSLK